MGYQSPLYPSVMHSARPVCPIFIMQAFTVCVSVYPLTLLYHAEANLAPLRQEKFQFLIVHSAGSSFTVVTGVSSSLSQANKHSDAIRALQTS